MLQHFGYVHVQSTSYSCFMLLVFYVFFIFFFFFFLFFCFFFSSRRRHTRSTRDWSSDVCYSDLINDFRKKYAELFALTQYFGKLHIDFADGEFVENKTVLPADLDFFKSSPLTLMAHRSEERRVGKECSARWREYAGKRET